MAEKTSIGKNVQWATVDFAVTLFVQFFVMKFIVLKLGLAALGVWSVLMSAAQIAGFFGAGTSAGAGRFLSMAHARNDVDDMERILSTIICGTIPLYLLLAGALYYPLKWGLPFVLGGTALQESSLLIGLALLAYVAQIIASSFVSALTSLHLGFLKSRISIIGNIFQALLSVALIAHYGLVGLAAAQITNYVLLSLLALYYLKKSAGVRLRRLLSWNRKHLKTVMSFGMKVQATSIAWSAFEMSIRFLMMRFGGASLAGLYEIAYKVAAQPRILMFFVGQNLAPILAGTWKDNKAAFFAFYQKTYARLSCFALLSLVGIALASPLVSLIMLGRIEPPFLLFSLLTALATACHIAAMPSELAAVAIGSVRYNFQGTVTALGTMLVCGTLLGLAFQGMGVAVGAFLSSLLAALTPIHYGGKVFALPVAPDFSAHLDVQGMVRDIMKKRKG